MLINIRNFLLLLCPWPVNAQRPRIDDRGGDGYATAASAFGPCTAIMARASLRARPKTSLRNSLLIGAAVPVKVAEILWAEKPCSFINLSRVTPPHWTKATSVSRALIWFGFPFVSSNLSRSLIVSLAAFSFTAFALASLAAKTSGVSGLSCFLPILRFPVLMFMANAAGKIGKTFAFDKQKTNFTTKLEESFTSQRMYHAY